MVGEMPVAVPKPRYRYRGYAYIAAAALLWGVSATLGRAVFTGRLLPELLGSQPIDPLILSQSRTTISFLVLLPVLAWRLGWRSLRVSRGDFVRLFLLGVLGVAGSNYFYYVGIERTNVATAIILHYTAPIWVLLYTIVGGSQRPTLQHITAVGLAITGIAGVIGLFGGSAGLQTDTIGLAASVLAAFAFAFYNVGGHRLLARHTRSILLLYTICTASIFWMLVHPPWRILDAGFSGPQWGFLFVFSLVSVLGPFGFYFAGLQYLEPTRAIVVSCLEPVFAILCAAIFLGELLRPLQIAGIALVLLAIVVVQMPERKTRLPVTLIEPLE